MYNYDHNQPGPSRHTFYNNNYSFYDYPPRNQGNATSSAGDRPRENQRGARQGFNSNFQHNSNVPHYPSNQWNQRRQQMSMHSQQIQSASPQHKEKKRDHNVNPNREKGYRSQQYFKKHKNSADGRSQQEDNNQESSIISEAINYRLYKCPNCSLQFDCSNRFNSYFGRVPLILSCKHTVCQECIPKMAKANTVLCPVCKNPSVLPPRYTTENLQDIFSPNFYLIGFILWCKSQGTNPSFMSLVPVNNNIVSRKSKSPTVPAISQLSKATCCFLSCNKTATLRCEDCSDVYCQECCTAVHKSAKSLWSHTQVPIAVESKKETLELEKCSEHNMDIEFYCTTCNVNSCCYCFLEKHEGHTKENLAKLNDVEMEEFNSNKVIARKILKQLLISQRRLKDLYNCSTSNIERKISNYFTNLHAKLQCIEKNLKKEVYNYSAEGTLSSDVDDLSSNLAASIDNLTNIVVACDTLEMKKMNLREISNKLKDVQNLPCYLLSDNNKGLDPLEFVAEPIVDSLEDFFKIMKSESCDFKLVCEENLPSDYEKDSTDLQYESDVESNISSLSKLGLVEEKPKKKAVRKPAIGSQIALENEPVEVTHIESLECFYVQLKKTQYQFSQMNRDINDYIKMGAPTVDHPQLHELYLVMYQTRHEKIWCRGRLTEIKNGEMEPLYEIFFIDYGSTQTVDVSKLRQITSDIAYKKPFAIHCELYNPSMASWAKNAHVYMGKMINGKQVSMLVKRIHSGVHEVDLMVLSSDRGQTSLIDILIHSCSNALSNSSDNESVSSQKFSYNRGYKIYGNSTSFKKFQQEKVILVNVIDPHNIFVHLATHAESLKKMNNMLKQTYKSSKKNNTCLPIEGTYVIVDYKDPIRGNWHRGLVKKVDITSEQCHILLIDWGLNIIVPWSHIRMIQENFTKLESQAIMIKLAHVEPLNRASTWLDSAAVFLQKYYRSQEVMRIVVHNVDPLEVALFEIVGDVDVCINTQLVMEHFADSTGKISQTLEWPRNDAEVKPFTDEDGLLASLLKKVETISEDSEDEAEKEVVRQKIEVVKFVNPDLIYIKFPMNEPQEMMLNKELQIHYDKERKTKESWKENEFCVVIYNHSYARGRILAKVTDKKYKVNVYDRAAEVVLSLERIFEFTKYFNKFPNVIFKSHMANIRPAGGDTWSLTSIEALDKMFEKYKDVYGTKVEGDVTNKSIPMHMWYTKINMGGALEASTTKFISLNNLLVKLGYAYRISAFKAGSVSGSNKSTRSSKSSTSNKSSKSTSLLLSAIERMASPSDDGTDQESTLSDFKEDVPVSDVLGFESSVSETKQEDISKSTDKKNCIKTRPKDIDWNELIEEEEKIRNRKTSDSQDSPYHTQEAEIEDWISAFPIKETEFYAWITCAETGGILYLREEKLQNVYKEMEANIKEYFDKKPPSPSQHSWAPGQLCTIHYKDHYYRGKVYKVNNPDDIVVVMIDFGSDHTLTANDLNREILYPKIPAFASKVKLDKVYPKSGSWLDSDYQTLLDTLSEYGKVIIKSSLEEEIPTAEIFTDNGINVNQTLVQLCPNLTRVEVKPQHKSDDDDGVVIEEESIVEEEDQLIVEVHDISEDDSVIEKEMVGSEVDTTKYTYNVVALSSKDPDEKIAVSVMFVLEYNKIALKETATITDEFFQLGEKMQEGVKHQPVIQNLEDGMPCVCPFSDDGVWYRAQIYNMEGLECGYVFVFFVDFGNIESVAVTDVKMMRPEWFEFPVSCHIANVDIELICEKNIQHVTQHMKKLYGKNKQAKIISRDPLRIHLYENGTDELCYSSLLEKRLVKLK